MSGKFYLKKNLSNLEVIQTFICNSYHRFRFILIVWEVITFDTDTLPRAGNTKMNLADCLLMLLLNTVVCICLPRVVTLLGASSIRSTWSLSGKGSDRTKSKSRPELSKQKTYPELNAIARQNQTSSRAI
jgi:hypothetical protein